MPDYNINLCRICQLPEHLDLVKTDTTIGNGDTYLGLLKYIFEDIFWIEDELISLACKTCLEKVTDIAEFKRLCLETNGRRGTFDPVKVELEAIKVEEYQAVTEQADDEPEEDTAPEQRVERKLSVSKQDQSVRDLKPTKTKRKTTLKTTNVKVKNKRRPKKAAQVEKLDDIDENIENENIDENTAAEGESKKGKKLLYVPEYKPNDNEKNCRLCKREFGSLSKLEEHINSDHVKIIYPCDICGETFKSLDSLYRHVFKHNGIRNYVCSICGKKFVTNGDLSHHKKRHEVEHKYLCDICPNKKFRTSDSLRTHKVIVHTDPKDYKYLCTECGKKFPCSGGLKVHMLRHNNIRNFSCHMCDKSFYTKDELLSHTPSHSNMRQFKCDMCPAEYKHKQILLRHKTKSHGIGNYKYQVIEKTNCNICGKNIASKDKLQRHIRTHTGLKPYSCRLCNQKFICKSYIKGHVRSKHDVDVDAPDYKTSLYFDVCDEEVSKDDATDAKAVPRDRFSKKARKK